MRRLGDEHGATAVFVAILFVVLFGFAAFVIDVGNLYWERRQLQNAADAAALAVAQDCALGDCGDYWDTAAEYADANNIRGAHVRSIEPEGLSRVSGQVTVTVETGDTEEAGTLQTWFAHVIGTDETATWARATVSWEGAGLGGAIPITLSTCDFMGGAPDPDDPYTVEDVEATAVGLPTALEAEWYHENQYWPPPSGSSNSEPEWRLFILHDPDDEDACTFSPGFSQDGETKMPAGFGWISTEDGSCDLDLYPHDPEDGSYWVPHASGSSEAAQSGDCVEAYTAPDIPVFMEFWHKTQDDRDPPHPDHPNKHQYRIYAPAGFYITGVRSPPVNKGEPTCKGNTWCVAGYFVKKLSNNPGGVVDAGVSNVFLTE